MFRGIVGRYAKRIAVFSMMLVLVVGAAALAGCSSANDEQVIRDGISKEFDLLKNPTKENLSQVVGEIDAGDLTTLESYGIDIYEFTEHAFRGFDYEIGDIVVDGDTATADLKVTNLDVAAIVTDTMTKVQNDEKLKAEIQKIAETGDQAAIMQYVFDIVYQDMDASDATVTTETQIKLTKTDNEWKVDDASMQELVGGMFKGLAS